jgi:hypothetical protein
MLRFDRSLLPPVVPKRLSAIWEEGNLVPPVEDRAVFLGSWPSELFQRNFWISFEPAENSIKLLADYIGSHEILRSDGLLRPQLSDWSTFAIPRPYRRIALS